MSLPLAQRIEALLFTRDEPLSEKTLADALAADLSVIRGVLEALESRYSDSAMELKLVKGGWRLQLREAYFPDAAALAEVQPVRYSRAFWETLAYIAYHQPVTRAEIDAVRGVTTSSGVYRQLFDAQWVHVVGQKEVPGRPDLLATTTQFLQDFSLQSADDLPQPTE
ncbi:SMC-Scp complex subunit ScpB [Suttonella sp. R2A3]|uniref:SMC-Scp complex subunit ScpB n=1 Tax=Suttonella sp. R2A3 TaxID=2908648 RepID=UPI001F0BFEAA|nr:SMC-Scp complex subunit ScpB [Suttonella sp. R2A3]UJF24468.1 SMC-Scp complex subunit ScpB [Suttonella sp. R2A3]